MQFDFGIWHEELLSSAWNGFVLDKNQLIPTARETFDGVLVIMDAVVQSSNTVKIHEGGATNGNFRQKTA
jgi:hypothetical protein